MDGIGAEPKERLLMTNDKMPVRILCVDDDPLTVNLLKRVLEPHGYEVVITTDSAEAMRIVLTEPIDLVTTDIRSPGMGGLGFIRRVREFDKSIPVIIISGHETKETAREAVRLGAFDYFNKPFDVVVLVDAVRRALLPVSHISRGRARNI